MPFIRPTIAPVRAPTVSPAVNGPSLPWEQSGGGAPDLAQQILAAYTGAGWVVPDLFLARFGDVSLVSGAVATWVNNGTAADATQGTGTARPAWSDSAANGRPGLTFDGGDLLSRVAIDLSAYTAIVQTVVWSDTDTGVRMVVERSANAGNTDGGSYITVNETAGAIRMLGRGITTLATSDSTALSMASLHVIHGSYDQGLATNEASVWHDGVDITSARTANNNTSGGLGNHALFIGARSGISLGLTGTIAAVITAVGTTAIPATAMATVDTLLRQAWGH